MTNSLSLILIATALVLLAGWMLYARRAVRRTRAVPGAEGALFAESAEPGDAGDRMSASRDSRLCEGRDGTDAAMASGKEAAGDAGDADVPDEAEGVEEAEESGESYQSHHFHPSEVPAETPQKATVKIRLDAAASDAGGTGESAAAEVRMQGAETSGREEGYLDDLQEAAVGLAKLMNSPASRRVPELLAEEGDKKAGESEEMAAERTAAESEFREANAVDGEANEDVLGDCMEDVEEETEAMEQAEATVETAEDEAGEPEATEEEAAEKEERSAPVMDSGGEESREESEVVQLDLFEVLGEELHSRIEELDSGLDELEELVTGIEASLAEFSSLDDEGADLSADGEEGGQVAEAA